MQLPHSYFSISIENEAGFGRKGLAFYPADSQQEGSSL